ELHKKIRGISSVDPLGRILYSIVLCFACDRITQHHSSDSDSAKEPDIVLSYRTDPVGHSFLIHLKAQVVKNIGRISKSKMPVDVPVKMIAGGIFHPVIQLHQLSILRRHIDHNVGGYSLTLIGKPLDQAG